MRRDEELLQAYLDGELVAAETAALEARLRAEPALAEALVSLARHEAIITEWAGASRAAQRLEPARVLHFRKLAFPRRIVAAIAVSAAAAALFLALSGIFSAPAGNETVAELEDVSGDVFVVQESGESVAAQRGTRLSLGQGLRTRGEGSSAVLAFPDTSRLEVGADTSIRLLLEGNVPPRSGKVNVKKVFLEEGVVAADMGNQSGRPYVLATPHGEASLPARSSFAIAPEGTRIESEKGEVRFTRSNGQSVAVPSGWYAVAAPAPANKPMVPRPVPEPRMTLNEPTGPLASAAFAPNSQTLATGCADGAVKLWDPTTGSVRNVLKGHRGKVRAVAYSADGTLLASAGEDRKVILWDPVNGTEVGILKGYKGPIESLAFSPNGLHLVSGGSQGNNQPEIRVWNVVTRQEVFTLAEHQMGVTAVAFSPDGLALATASRDKTVRLWETATFTVRHVLGSHQGPGHAVAFAPDGSGLASGGQDRTIRFWDVGLGTERAALPGFAPQVRSLAFSPDGRFLAAAALNIRLRNLTTGREQLIFQGNKQQQALPNLVLISPDGKSIAATGTDKTLRFWDMTDDDATGG